jgi:hypothetical protein
LEKIFTTDANKKAKYSGKLLEMRKKEQALVQLLKYQEAQKVKKEADALEFKELAKIEIDVNASVENRLNKIKESHKKELCVLLKRIERDRNDHEKEKSRNLERLAQKNKNQMHDIAAKQAQEYKRVEAEIKKSLYDFKAELKINTPKIKVESPFKPKLPSSQSKKEIQ